MYYVYILKSETNKSYYVGCTNNLDKRVKEHNKGLSRYTKNKGPWQIVYKESYIDLSTARKREIQIKHWKKRAAIERLITAPIV